MQLVARPIIGPSIKNKVSCSCKQLAMWTKLHYMVWFLNTVYIHIYKFIHFTSIGMKLLLPRIQNKNESAAEYFHNKSHMCREVELNKSLKASVIETYVSICLVVFIQMNILWWQTFCFSLKLIVPDMLILRLILSLHWILL